MPVFYQFSFRDGSGEQIALLTTSEDSQEGGVWHSCSYDHIENGVGHATLSVDGRLPFIEDLNDRTILKIKRKVVRGDGNIIIDWYTEWEGFLDYIDDKTFLAADDNVNVVRLEFSSYLDLVRCRTIQYDELTTYTSKDGPGETVIKELVEENAGPSAGVAARYADGVVYNLTVEADAAQGNPWVGHHSAVPLLDTIAKIGNATDMFFDVVVPDPDDAPDEFEFRCYYLQRGDNRSQIGVDPTTGGLNAYGFAPVVFSLVNQNMSNPSLKTNFRDSLSSVTMIGSGQDEDTLHQNRMNAFDIARSNWSVREGIVRSTAEYTDDALLYGANEAIIANRVKTTLDFDVIQIDNCLYGRDYFWGDVVTAIYKNVTRSKRISSVGVQVTPPANETIKPVMLDLEA